MEISFFKKYLLEGIGTFFLVFTVFSTSNPLAIGLILAAAIYIGANISGGHYNPAVTLALWLRGKFSLIHLPGYIFFQVLGAFAASALLAHFSGKAFFPQPLASIGTFNAILVEIIGTFIFCSVILETTSPEQPSFPGNGLIIGLTLAAVAFMGGAFSGGAFNPAVGAGPILFDCLKGGTSLNLLPIYLIGPFTGGLLASIWYRLTHKN